MSIPSWIFRLDKDFCFIHQNVNNDIGDAVDVTNQISIVRLNTELTNQSLFDQVKPRSSV